MHQHLHPAQLLSCWVEDVVVGHSFRVEDSGFRVDTHPVHMCMPPQVVCKAGDVHPSSFMAATALLLPARPATCNRQPSWPCRRLKASPCTWNVSGAPAVWPACVCNTGLLVTCMCEGALPSLLQRGQQAAAAHVASQVGKHATPHDSGMRPRTWGSIRAWQHSLPLHLELYMSRQDQGAPELLQRSKQAAAALLADNMQASALAALLPSDLEIPVNAMVQ